MRRDWIIACVPILLWSGALQASMGASATPFRITESSQNRIVVEISSPLPLIERASLNGEDFDRVSMDKSEPSAGIGMPDLPIISTMLAIPVNADYTVDYHLSDPRQYQNIRPAPVSEDSASFTLSHVYSDAASYPSRQVIPAETASLRDFRVLPLQSCPFSWDPVSNVLTHYRQIRINIELSYPKTDTGPKPYTGYSYAFRNLYEARIQNFDTYRDLVPGPQAARVLIIHGENSDPVFTAKLDEFVSWKRQKGFEVSVAGTQVAGTTNTAIKSYIQSRYDNPATRPDFIILIGDVSGSLAVPTFYETDSEHNGEGDYPYTYLSGNDMLGDAFIGRMSAEDVSQVLTLFNKVYTYEKNVNINPPLSGWMNRMLIIGDPTVSGRSCVYTARYIREIAQYANPDYGFVENYTGGFVSTINGGLNQGVGFFAYRGYYGVSGWYPSNSVVNGFKLTHAVIPTCETGSFAATSLSEDFIRMGTESVPAGAATCIGMSTPGTHTLYNNALISGIMSGIFCNGMRTMGEALLNGRLYLHEVYGATQPVAVKSLAHWCNLMGDPTLETWVGVARQLNLEVPPSMPQGLTTLELVVRDSLQMPVEGVSVTVWSPTLQTIVARSFSMANGVAVLDLPTDLGTELLITAAKQDFKPRQQTLPVDSTGTMVYLAHQVIDNGSQGSSGNGDGIANASETIALAVDILNSTVSPVNSLNAVLSSEHPGIQITMTSSSYPNLGPGQSSQGSQPFIISINPSLAPIESARFVLDITDSASNHYQSVFYLQVLNARLSITDYSVYDGADGALDPGETSNLSLTVFNEASYPAMDLFGELQSLNSLLIVSDSLAYFGDLPPQSQSDLLDGYQVRARDNLVAGMQIPMRVRFYNSSGFEQICLFNIGIGSVAQSTPLGPDGYGYLIYDETDTAYPDCPVYDWVEIVPSLGGSGTLIPDLADTGAGTPEGDTIGARVLKEVMLPFNFRFYGIDYDRITVCVNGFIAFGNTDNGEFRNVRLPGGQGPCPMIAVFWDDLTLPLSSGIYKYYDEAGHRLIIQYQELINGYDDSSIETFQVIFYDPLFHHSGLGDGIIKLQYKTFNNVDAGGTSGYYDTPLHGNFCTIGIKDHSNTRGLEYTFNNTYAPAAVPLANEKALLITTVPVHHQQAHLVVDELIMYDGNNLIPEPGEDIEIGLRLSNSGFGNAAEISANLSCLSEFASVVSSHSLYPDIAPSGMAVNVNPFLVSVSDSCPDGAVLSFTCEVSYPSSSHSFPFSLIVKRPQVVFSGYLINDAAGDGNGIVEPGDNAVFVTNLTNNTALEARNLLAAMSCSNEHVSLLDTSCEFTSVPPWTTVQAAFRFSISSSAVLGSTFNANLSYSCDLMPLRTAQIPIRIGSSGLYDDFENNFGSYVSMPSGSGWQWGTDQSIGAHSGVKLWGTLLNQQYPNDINWKLISPSIYIGPNNYLEYWQSYDTQSAFDGGCLEIYAGGSWNLLTPENGYPMASVLALNGPGFSGFSAWSRVRCDLGAFANSNVRFRWVFASDSSVQGQGWFIDDVRTIGFANSAGKISGSINLDGSQPELSEVWISSAAGMAVNPEPDLTYTLFLPAGNHAVSGSAPGYKTATSTDLALSLSVPYLEHHILIHELKPVTELTPGHTEDLLVLQWEAPEENCFNLTGYKISRRINAGNFEPALVTTATRYSEQIDNPGAYQYYVQAVYDEGESLPTTIFSTCYPFPDSPDFPPLPTQSRLLGNFPNPFNPITTISFELAAATKVKLQIYNLRGQLVNAICDMELSAGRHRLNWDGRDTSGRKVASGVYLYRLITSDYSNTRKMLLLK